MIRDQETPSNNSNSINQNFSQKLDPSENNRIMLTNDLLISYNKEFKIFTTTLKDAIEAFGEKHEAFLHSLDNLIKALQR